jgi:leucyl-tRNA synthetase
MDNKDYNYIAIEEKWQKKWFDKKIYIAERKKDKKFFLHFAYPGVSGYLHVGHMRGFTYCDIIARYKRMTGYDVIFPAGFHASGIPSIGFAKKVERGDEATINSLKEYGVSEETIQKMKDPKEVVNYFGHIYVEDYWKKFGFLIDYSRIMSSISEGYKKFIEWQFFKLKEKQLLIQKPHFAPFCPNCGPVAVDKSETDILTGGSAEILEFTTIKFKLKDGTILPAATLRPETIFGITNMWVNPDVDHVKIKVGDERWICSKQAAEKLAYQIENVKIIEESISGKSLIGKTVKIPIVDREVPVLSGPFADPNVATGIVMSVPAHAPFDWIALVESGQDILPITIIDVKGFGKNPAKEVCGQLGIKSQTETEKLEIATEEVYKKEFHKGFLNEKCGSYAGIKISEIKDDVKNELLDKNLAVVMREFSEKVICRCNEKVMIKKIPDQWFIKYSDYNLTQDSKDYVSYMNIFPEDYKRELPGVLDWFDDRACIRKGSWMGTEFPFKKGWIIEPISDSTLYPAYYLISKFVNEDKIKPEEMTEEFFDYIFLNRGKEKINVWGEIKSDINYWYPVDINLGGKEHKTVHFPVFIMNHVAIMPEDKRPQGIFVHWWVTQKGKEKISKSKGGAEHINEAATTYGVDAMRLYYAHIGSPFVDVEWDSEAILKYKSRLKNIWNQIHQLSKLKDENSNKQIDNWLISSLQRRIKKSTDAFNIYDLRIATNEIFFECQKDIRWYVKRGGCNKSAVETFVTSWIKLMTPVAPHLAEELWEIFYEDKFVSNEEYPIYDKEKLSINTEVGEYLLEKVVDDVNEIIKVTKITPKKIFIYTSANWKTEMMAKAIKEANEEKIDIGSLIKEAMADPENRRIGKEISQFAGKLPGEAKKLNESDKERYLAEIDEKNYLECGKSYLKELFDCEVEIIGADDKNIYDPSNKKRFAIPLKPAIYIE